MDVAFIAGLATAAFLFPSWRRGAQTKSDDDGYYENFDVAIKPRSPAVFGIAWFLLYILLSISIGVWVDRSNNVIQNSSIWSTTWIFVLINFIANKLWDTLFFDFRSPVAAAVDAAVLWITALVVIILWAVTDASYTVPIVLWSIYLLWLTYALVLSIWIAAKGTPKLVLGDAGYAEAIMNGTQ